MADEQYIDMITGKPLEPWAEQAMQRRPKPKTATPAMIAAGERAIAAMSDKHWGRAEACWNAMLAFRDAERVAEGDGSLASGKCTCFGNDPWCALCRASEKRVPTSREVMLTGGVDPDAPFKVGPFPAEMRQAAPTPQPASASAIEAQQHVLSLRAMRDVAIAGNGFREALDFAISALTPDAGQVVLAERMREALIHADLKIRSFPGTDQSDVQFIREVLDRTPASDNEESPQ